MSVVAVPTLQLNPRRSQTCSLGTLSSDSSLTLWRSKLCGGASFVAAPHRESSTLSYFYLHMTVKSKASHSFHIADEQFQRKNSDNSDIHGHPRKFWN